MQNKAGQNKVCAAIVTYNRKSLLRECLAAVQMQNHKPDAIVVIDNASTDHTPDMLIREFPSIKHLRLPENTGGAGGFYEGIKWACQQGYDWIWIMDDDVVPTQSALEQLLQAAKKVGSVAFLASKVQSEFGNSMNVPRIDTRPSTSYYPDWEKFLDNGLVKITSATFVSLLFSAEVVKEIGLPIKEFFIWGDDTEYTLRATRNRNAFLVGSSIVIHKRKIEAPPNIVLEKNPNRIKLYFYFYRNNAYIMKKYYGMLRYMLFVVGGIINLLKTLITFPYPIKKAISVGRGLLSSLFFYPKINYLE